MAVGRPSIVLPNVNPDHLCNRQFYLIPKKQNVLNTLFAYSESEEYTFSFLDGSLADPSGLAVRVMKYGPL